MWRTLLVGLGGFVGSVARYWIGGWVQNLAVAEFPFGTLVVNASGSFLLGIIVTLAIERGVIGPDLRLALAVGVCGGYTTMSSFSYETFALVQRGLVGAALWNVGGTLLLCMTGVWLGAVAARAL